MAALDVQLVELAGLIDDALGHPQIHAFHYPSAQDSKSLKGDFCAVGLTGGGSGLSYALAEDCQLDWSAQTLPRVGERAIDWAERFAQPIGQVSGPQRSAALATINALYNALLRRTQTPLPVAQNSFGLSALAPGERIGMIGFFPPLVKRLRAMQVDLTVIELRRDLERAHPGLLVTCDRSKLAPCTKVLCTSTTMLNQTLPDMLIAAESAQEFALLGPSAGCPPDPLFQIGVQTLACAHITDDVQLWQRLVAGERLGAARQKCTVSQTSVPTTHQLLAQL